MDWFLYKRDLHHERIKVKVGSCPYWTKLFENDSNIEITSLPYFPFSRSVEDDLKFIC